MSRAAPPRVVGRDGSLPGWMLLLVGLLLGWIYTYGLSTNPLKWEEPRRCLVAMEMIHSGNYVVPTVLGEPYLKKPPLQNWLLVALSGNDAGRVGAVTLRGLSLLALIGLGTGLWRMGLSAGGVPHVLPALVFVTLGTVLQSARAGEIDTPLCFLVAAALFCFELGRRRGSAWLQWFVSQVLIGAGVLMKVVAPLFFYPPVLFWAWRRRAQVPFSWPAFAAGLVGMLAVIAAWLVPYTRLGAAEALVDSWSNEFMQKASTDDRGLLLHMLVYPVLLFLWLLPWSLHAVVQRRAAWLHAGRRIARDPWLGLAASVVGWGLLVFLFVPAQKGRYLLPVLPFASVLFAVVLDQGLVLPAGARSRPPGARLLLGPLKNRGFWLAMGAAWTALVWTSGRDMLPDARGVLLPWALGLVVLAATAVLLRSKLDPSPVIPLLALGLTYGLAYAGFLEIREAIRNVGYVREATRIAASIEAGTPVVCSKDVPLKFAYALSHELGAPLGRSAPTGRAAYWVSADPNRDSDPGEPLVDAGGHRLFRVQDAEAWSFLGEPLRPPDLPTDVRLDFEARLARARAELSERPDDPTARIWVGRRTAYLGRYREAVAVFSRAIEAYPGEPRLYRHRGHRYITLRRLGAAIADLELAAELVDGSPDRVEPDGLPNALGVPTSTLKTNIWYHLGLAYYLRGDLDQASRCYRECLRYSDNDDMRVAASHWLYMTLRRSGRREEAEQVLQPVHEGMRIIENHAYHELLMLYSGLRTPERLIEALDVDDAVSVATVVYGVGNWYHYGGDRARALQMFQRVIRSGSWAAFGRIAAEADLDRMIDGIL